MDEFGFRSTSGDSLSVSYAPPASSPAFRKATASRNNVALYISQPSRLPSGAGSSIGHSPVPASSKAGGKTPITSNSASGSAGSSSGIGKLRSLRNMLPFGPKQPNNSTSGAAPVVTASRKPTIPSVQATPTQVMDLRHRRSSSSIPTPSGTGGVSKQGFLSVGRRTSLSFQKEKSLPAVPPLPRSNSEDLRPRDVPDATISGRSSSPNKVDVTRVLPLPDDPFKKPSPNAASITFFQRGSSREDFGTARPRGDLSTIVESELSHLSILRHSPPLEPCQEGGLQIQEDNDSDKQMLAQLAEQDDKNNNLSIMHGQDTDLTAATADLSASWEAGVKEFRQSLKLHVPDNRKSGDGRTSPSSYSISPATRPSSAQDPTPPTSVPVTSNSEVQLNSPEVESHDEVSFELGKVDPDLAAILEPMKRISQPKDDFIAAAESIEPPPPMDSSPSASPSPDLEEFGGRLSADLEDKWGAGTSSRRSTNSHRRSVGMQSSPARRSRPPSLVLSSDSLPINERTRKTSIERTPMNNNVRPSRLSPTPRPGSTSPRTSYEDLTETIRRPGFGSHSRAGLSKPGADLAKRRAPSTRLYETPSRPSTASSTYMGRVSSEGGRPFLSSARTSEEHPPRVYSPTPRSRPTTSLGMSSRMRNGITAEPVERPATALSSVGRGPPPLPQRSRKRSLSAATDPRRNAPDWMGPRTVRAFAAAGLLDEDKDRAREQAIPPIPSRTDSRMRMANSRPSFDRDYRPLQTDGTATSSYAPSRLPERGQPPQIGRRRASSRTMASAEIASTRIESPVTSITSSSNARTVFSSSTATSLTCSSPQQQYQTAHLESEISALKEKHSTEMAAILSALADSQQTSKALREENTQLQGRIRDLEEQLADLAEHLEEARRQPPPRPPSSFTRSFLKQHRSSPQESPRGSPCRDRAFVGSPVESLASDYDVTETHTTMRENGGLLTPNFMPSSLLQSRENRPRTRASTTSSVFPVLPSNMSMLLHDEGSDSYSNQSNGLALLQSNMYASSAGSPSASPTLNVNHLVTSSFTPVEKSRHATTLSLSSIEMSMLSSLPGSPESLKLKPEHEKHLCDLKSLDFSVIDSD